MAHHEVVENNVKKELSYALIGILAFLGLVLLILISAIVRPAGNHVDVAKLNAEVEAKAAASAAAAKPAGSTPAATSPAAGETTTATANADTATGPNATVASPDNASMTPSSAPTATAKTSTIEARNASTAEAKAEIKAKTGETPNIAPPVASAVKSQEQSK
ncbi:MAG TPA: hypothetical protein DEP59_08045 [Moraxella sp.]|uniref:hypothetical protein n=1 Tax=Faucicola osloensis TaxID=34062 RepID=UPI000EE10C63|nr:hypothetical protein [Moraxella osloensis]MCK6157750.1 hypothetical protein [Moraxella osloensis]MCK6158534.1 hypothetical protein [Moraxella osloensis]HCC66928.1 hypothetical protein [Moraxella sp.]